MGLNDRIEVTVEELVLDGFGPGERERIAESFRRELDRLLRVRGLPGAVDATHDAVGGLPELPRTGSPQRLGEALAEAVHACLSGPGAPSPAAKPRTASRPSDEDTP